MPRQPDALRRTSTTSKVTSAHLQQQVIAAQEIQLERQQCLNHALSPKQLEIVAKLNENDHDFLVAAMEKLSLSHRAYHRTLRLARTIADLNGDLGLNREHLLEALSYRALDALLTQLRAL